MPFPDVVREAKASTCVRLQGFPGKPVAVGKHVIDFVNGFAAMPRRIARTERRSELQARYVLPLQSPAGKTPGLARQVIECEFEGPESAGKACGIDEAIRRRS